MKYLLNCSFLENLDTASFEHKFMLVLQIKIQSLFHNDICGGTCVNGLSIGVKTGKGSGCKRCETHSTG